MQKSNIQYVPEPDLLVHSETKFHRFSHGGTLSFGSLSPLDLVVASVVTYSENSVEQLL